MEKVIDIKSLNDTQIESLIKRLDNTKIKLEYEIDNKKRAINELINNINNDPDIDSSVKEICNKLNSDNINELELNNLKVKVEEEVDKKINEFNTLLSNNQDLLKILYEEVK